MKKLILSTLVAVLIPSTGFAENRIDCFSDANGSHSSLIYTGNIGEYKGRLNMPLRVLVSTDENKISFKSPEKDWFNYYIDLSNGDKYSSYPLSTDPGDIGWVKIAFCNIPDGLTC